MNPKKLEMRDGKPVLVQLPKLNFIDDKAGKPVASTKTLAAAPSPRFGNSDGDFQMLQWTTVGDGARFALIEHRKSSNVSQLFKMERMEHCERKNKLAKNGGCAWRVSDFRPAGARSIPATHDR